MIQDGRTVCEVSVSKKYLENWEAGFFFENYKKAQESQKRKKKRLIFKKKLCIFSLFKGLTSPKIPQVREKN